MQEALTEQVALVVAPGAARAGRRQGRSSPRSIWQIGLPVLAVALVLAGLIALQLRASDGNLTRFINFGQRYTHYTHPPGGAVVRSRYGYDGQFFYVQAHDPLALRDSTIAALRAADEGFRIQRMGYPAIAFLLSGGRSSLLPAALLGLNVAVLLALAGCFAAYARRRGWSVRWAVALALMPGFLLPALRDLSDPLATACALAGVLLAQSRKRWAAAIALTVAVLTREVTMAIVVALGIELALRGWRARAQPGGWRAVWRSGWPVVAVPAAAFALWQAYLMARYGGPLGTSVTGIPVLNLVQEVRSSIAASRIPTYGAWDTIYVLLIAAGVLSAVASLRRGITPVRVAACAAALCVLMAVVSDPWGDTRISAPLFALLLVDALQSHHRRTLALCGAVAGMTLLIPISLPGVLA